MTPLPFDEDAAASSWGGGVFEILFILIVFFCILFLAYVVTRFIAKRSSGRMKSRYIEIVDSLGIGADAQLLIVKAGGEFFLAAKSQKQISLLTKLELTADALQDGANGAPNFADSFRAVLESKLSRARARHDSGAANGNDPGGPAGDLKGENGETPPKTSQSPARAVARPQPQSPAQEEAQPLSLSQKIRSGIFRDNIDRIKDMK